MADLQIVTTPTHDWLAKHARTCTKRMLVGSPYVNNAIIELTDMVPKDVTRTLVTRTDLRDFAVGSSNLDTLCALAKEGVTVRSLSGLHAKLYVFDDSSALVTSANATASGMWRNLECGLGTEDKGVVKALACSLMSGLGTGVPPEVFRIEDLEELYPPLEAIKESLPQLPRTIVEKSDESTIEETISITDREKLLQGFSGWKRLTLEGVLSMQDDEFGLDDVYKVCGPSAAQQYPENHNVNAKLRQQLQLLRNIGIIEFVSPGNYRRTLTV